MSAQLSYAINSSRAETEPDQHHPPHGAEPQRRKPLRPTELKRRSTVGACSKGSSGINILDWAWAEGVVPVAVKGVAFEMPLG